MAGSWTDIAGSLNPDNAEIFHVVPEPGTGVLLVLGLAVLATRRRRPRYRAQRGAVSKPTATRR
jgi:hypothetical protein